MIQLTALQIKLAEQLLLSVKKNERNVTYKELAGRVNPPIHHRHVGKNIGQVSILCHELGLPLLSAKVINQSTHTVGDGFYPLLKMMGIPTEGKTEAELCKEQIKAIRECTEWYKLEDYLGLNVGMPRPVPKLDPKLLDAKRPQGYLRSVDVLNNCFGNEYLGKTYEGWMRGAIAFQSGGEDYSVWFPKLAVNGKAASSSGWINIISSDGSLIEEFGSENTFIPDNNIVFVFAKQGSEPYFFKGVFRADFDRSTEEHHYYLKIADIADLRGAVPTIYYYIDEDRVDNDLISDLGKEDSFVPADGFDYNGKPEPVPKPLTTGGRIVYPRDRRRAINALAHAGYVCEIDPQHPTFIRKKSGKQYTEPHHLVPMSQQSRFPVSLDVEENIVSLCSTCHNHIHYGKGSEELLKKLYAVRKEALRSAGINITEEELLLFYDL
jgi:hypothetical protein